MTIKITTTGLDELIRDLREFRTTGIRRAQEALDDALDRAAETSWGLAHVHEGDLRASQEVHSDQDPTGWTGTIAYAARGARYEIERGGEHAAFIDSLAHLTEAAFEAALDRMFDGLR